LCTLNLGAEAQKSVDIFADISDNDSLKKLVTIFTDQLAKAGPFTTTVQKTSQYKGSGIYIARVGSGQPLKPSAKLLAAGTEGFSINADEKTVQLLANSYLAVGHGIFTYLDFLGYRYYFANPDWYIIPSKPVLFRKWNIVSSPSFYHRRIWYGYGTGSKIADADYQFWFLANRQGGTINAYFGHSYGNIIAYNRDTFLLHPEWFYPATEKGKLPTGDPKFDMSREDLIQFLIRYTEREIEKSLKDKTERYKMISMAPSDGPGTCNSPACQQLGTITDRVYYLVNRVARAIQKKYPSTLIGCMAYGEYSPPPTKKVEPNVFVGVTTAFNNSTFTIDQLIDEWRKKGAMVGIYDYFSWYAWDFDVPGQSLASRTNDLIKSIRKYAAKGVKAYEAESSIGWISKGLGYYLAARQMWDINADPEKAKKEFFANCFGRAADLMEKLWGEWENYKFTMIRDGDLARWIDYTVDAGKKETSEAVARRLLQVKSYLHYLFLYRNYQMEKTEANLLKLLSYGYRKLDEGSVSGYPAVYVLGGQSGFPGMGFEENAKWKADKRPVGPAETNQFMTLDRNQLRVPDAVKTYTTANSFQHVPNLGRYQKLVADSANQDAKFWMTNEWVIGIKNKSANNYIDFIGDYIGDPTNKKSYKINVYPYRKDGDVTGQTPLVSYAYNKKQVKDRISLAGLNPGNYTMIVEDPVKIFKVAFSPAVDYSMVMRADRPVNATGIYYGFLYVPPGVKKFNIVKTIVLHLVTPTGRKINFNDNKQEDVQVEVLKGEEGLWQIKPLNGKLYVEGIPPYLGTSAYQMLVPAGAQ
jgi:hypothetical protein